ncbi:hypothetical protein [Halapricum hydrolyticum]|uniref:Uncharacterized protein n=1 Tax=Halapricum hydrolyticum TaxID=2979991 RepID=A0AAE3IBM7_9EURY|nr:hypothetical protein [Halapricum hydrolyticum]MCU4716811.1 hypothetical protein [Halapricum hydrolyticum]MCU4725584.1 hypothetical protein [Halapricum hydrolyticum]
MKDQPPGDPPAFIPDRWSAAMRTLYGRYYDPALDTMTAIAAGLALLGAYGLRADIDGSLQVIVAAAALLAYFLAVAVWDERRWRA